MKNLDLLFLLGRPFGPIYSVVQSVRASLYKKSIFKVHKVNVPVISVGNLTMGGTGKTPMVMFLAEALYEKGYRPAIVSRGYGGKAKQEVNIVSDGEELKLDPVGAGDEPYLLASMLRKIPVLTGKKRIIPCRYAVEKLNSNLIILDDGFQHLGMHRDINLVLFNATNLAGNSRVFPGGDLREPVKALHRADLFVLTGVTDDNSRRASSFQQLLEKRFPNIPVCLTGYLPPKIYGNTESSMSPDELAQPVLSFSGIANPERFHMTLDSFGIPHVGKLCFEDHVQYTDKTLKQLKNTIQKTGAQSAITTLKDYVKLQNQQLDIPLSYISHNCTPSTPLIEFIVEQLDAI